MAKYLYTFSQNKRSVGSKVRNGTQVRTLALGQHGVLLLQQNKVG